jgi:hypothetical protein
MLFLSGYFVKTQDINDFADMRTYIPYPNFDYCLDEDRDAQVLGTYINNYYSGKAGLIGKKAMNTGKTVFHQLLWKE